MSAAPSHRPPPDQPAFRLSLSPPPDPLSWAGVGLLIDGLLGSFVVILPAARWNWPAGAWMGFPLAMLLCWSHHWLLPLFFAPLGRLGAKGILIPARGLLCALTVVILGGLAGLFVGFVLVLPSLIIGPAGIMLASLTGVGCGGALAGWSAYGLALEDRGLEKPLKPPPGLRLLWGATALILATGLFVAQTPLTLLLVLAVAAVPTLLAGPPDESRGCRHGPA